MYCNVSVNFSLLLVYCSVKQISSPLSNARRRGDRPPAGATARRLSTHGATARRLSTFGRFPRRSTPAPSGSGRSLVKSTAFVVCILQRVALERSVEVWRHEALRGEGSGGRRRRRLGGGWRRRRAALPSPRRRLPGDGLPGDGLPWRRETRYLRRLHWASRSRLSKSMVSYLLLEAVGSKSSVVGSKSV